MRPKPGKLERKHPRTTREAMEDMKDGGDDSKPIRNHVRYMEPNRDRALGEADRTGRHYDEDAGEHAEDEGAEASEDHEAD
jgi:hypothetical protein